MHSTKEQKLPCIHIRIMPSPSTSDSRIFLRIFFSVISSGSKAAMSSAADGRSSATTGPGSLTTSAAGAFAAGALNAVMRWRLGLGLIKSLWQLRKSIDHRNKTPSWGPHVRKLFSENSGHPNILQGLQGMTYRQYWQYSTFSTNWMTGTALPLK